MFKSMRNLSGFEYRSTNRDIVTDAARMRRILDEIDEVLKEVEGEKAGLQRRLQDALDRSSVTVGSSAEDYESRDALSDTHQKSFNTAIRYSEHRLRDLDENIESYGSIQTLVATALRAATQKAETWKRETASGQTADNPAVASSS